MQKRKIEDNKIWEAYDRLVSGESLTSVSNSDDIKLHRGTLRRYIENVVIPNLDEEQKETFEQIMNKNFRGNSTEHKRENRNIKKKMADEQLKESDIIKTLASNGVTPEQVENLYKRLKENKKTSLTRATFAFKYAEHLQFLLSKGFTPEEAFDLFMRRPKLFTYDTKTFKKSFDIIATQIGDETLASMKIKEDPWINFKLKEKERGEE